MMMSHVRFLRDCTIVLLSFLLLFVARPLRAQTAASEARPAESHFGDYRPRTAPVAQGCLLRAGDRLAICGDSITEQKMYSRIMETYLTVCAPELRITVRQHGWSGETAERFLQRMAADCLRFAPTVATACYGMNDYRYRPYDDANAQSYSVTWGKIARAYSAQQLSQGVNLAGDFSENPFSEAFRKVDEAVLAKQVFETKQMKSVLHGAAKDDLEAAVAKSEAEHTALAAAVQAAFVPVRHTIVIKPQEANGAP